MASPSLRQAQGERKAPQRKDGIRCEGVFPAEHKFSGETCNALLLEKDPEQGLGARCGRCGTFHAIEELSQKVEGVQSDSAAHDQIQPQTQSKQGEEKMTGTADSTEVRISKTALFKQRVGELKQEASAHIREVGRKLESTKFDPDKIEEIIGAPIRIKRHQEEIMFVLQLYNPDVPERELEITFPHKCSDLDCCIGNEPVISIFEKGKSVQREFKSTVTNFHYVSNRIYIQIADGEIQIGIPYDAVVGSPIGVTLFFKQPNTAIFHHIFNLQPRE